MSSILKALKKIDETSRSADNGHPWPQPGARDAIAKNIKRRWLVRRLTTYALVAACLISLVVVLYWRQTGRLPQQQAAATKPTADAETGPVHRAKLEQPAAPGGQPNAARQQLRPAAQSEPVDKPMPPANRTAPNTPKEPAEIATQSDDDARRAPEPRRPLPKRSKKAATKVKPPASKRNDGPASAPVPAASSSKAARTDKAPEYSRLQNSDLVLQAIAWSPEPAERIAVINGSIVREGETIDDFTLEQIRPDDIVLNDGGKRWQLEFGLKQ